MCCKFPNNPTSNSDVKNGPGKKQNIIIRRTESLLTWSVDDEKM